MRGVYLGTFIWAWVCNSACAEADAKLLAAPLIEELNAKLPISGSVVAGVMAAKPSENAIIAPYAYIPTATDGVIVCVLVRTQDGRYRSKNTYIVPPRSQGFVRFEYASRYEALLRGLTVDDVAVLVSLGNCEDRKRSELFIATWGSPIEYAPTSIFIATNSGRKTLTVAAGDAVDVPQECRALTSGVRRVFDSWCHFQLPDPFPDIVRVRVVGWRGSESVDSTVLFLRLAF